MGGNYTVEFLAFIVVGLIAGWLAGMIMRGSGYGILGNIVVGVLGALIAGFLANLFLPGDGPAGFNLASILFATLGAIVLILILRAIPGRQPFE